LAGGGGDHTYDGASEDDDNDSRHHVGGGVALGVVKEDLDKGIAGWVVIMVLTSPTMKHSVMTIKKPRVPFTAAPTRMARGRVFEASLISSAVF
jgi:hypothetical protein